MQPIVFEGFAEDCTIAGRVTMFGERLTDFLNGQERFRLNHVVCQSLADGHEVAVDSLSVERSELLCVVATGPRGSEKQRVAVDRVLEVGEPVAVPVSLPGMAVLSDDEAMMPTADAARSRGRTT
jgi:hypothetical protein